MKLTTRQVIDLIRQPNFGNWDLYKYVLREPVRSWCQEHGVQTPLIRPRPDGSIFLVFSSDGDEVAFCLRWG